MKSIRIKDKNFELYIEHERVQNAVKSMAKRMSEDLKNDVPIFIGILNGSFIFASDFIRAYNAPCEISFAKLSSYEQNQSTGVVQELVGIKEDLSNRTVVVLEDIIDTGSTLEKIHEILHTQHIKKLKIATLFFKPEVYKKKLAIDYKGIEIPDEFIVGYGLDYDGLGRNLPEIYKLSN